MSHDPAKEACSSEYHTPDNCMLCGPSGNKNLVNQNEKGILERDVHSIPMTTSSMAVTHQKWNV